MNGTYRQQHFYYIDLASLQKGSFQRVLDKEIKTMVKEVDILKRYLKNSCTNNDKCNVPFHIHVGWEGKGSIVIRLGKFICWVHKIMA
jgi:hypothetical protein